MPRYRIEYYNELWKDWIYFDTYFYVTKKDAQVRVKEYNNHDLDVKLRITKTTILDEKPRRTRRKDLGTKVTTEKA